MTAAPISIAIRSIMNISDAILARIFFFGIPIALYTPNSYVRFIYCPVITAFAVTERMSESITAAIMKIIDMGESELSTPFSKSSERCMGLSPIFSVM